MLTRDDVKDLKAKLEPALAGIGKALGWSFKLGNGRFAATLEIKLICAKDAPDGTKTDPLEAEFKRLASYYGFAPEDFGKRFRSAGRTFAIAGIKPKARSRPIIARNLESGKMFVFGRDIKRLLD